MNARRVLPAGAGPSPARPERFKKGSYLRLHPDEWASVAPKIGPELAAAYFGLLALAPRGELTGRGHVKLGNLLDIAPTRARELIDALATTQFAGGPLVFVEDRKGERTVRLAINNGLLVLHTPAAAGTAPAPASNAQVRVSPPRDFPTLIAAARGAFCDLAGDGACELADALLAALAEREPDGQYPGGRQVAFYRELAELHAIGGNHVAVGLHEMLRRPDLPADAPLSYLRAIVVRRVAESGRANGDTPRRPTPEATPPITRPSAPGADVADVDIAPEPEVRRTADGRRIASDFNPDDMF